MFTSSTWNLIGWSLTFLVPTLIVWCIALYFCYARRRENPKGAAYLALAILMQLLGTASTYLLLYFVTSSSGSGSTWGLLSHPYVMMAVRSINWGADIGMWVFFVLAVFARPEYYDSQSLPQFEHDPI